AARILLRHGLEQRRIGEVAEDQVIEAERQVRQLALVPRAEGAGEHAETLRPERTEEPADRRAEVTAVVEAGALDQARQVRVLLEVVDDAVEDRRDHAPVEAPRLARRPALAAL